jgi:RNA polymerase sigma-70 factor (ECF subfamily)
MLAKAETTTADRQARLRSLVDDHHRLVARTLRKGGVPRSDLDDEVQRTFIIVSRRLDDLRLGAERSFLREVARNRASHARRSFARQREFPSDPLPERSEQRGTPEDMAGRRQMRALLDSAVASLSEGLRSVFLLYEVEEMDMPEIAAALGLPRGTVASRLRRAREQLRSNLVAIELAEDLGVPGLEGSDGPALLRSERVSRLERALLRTGMKKGARTALREKTIAACARANP